MIADSYFGFRDLEFEKIPVACRSSGGTPYVRLVPIGMPRIPSKSLDLVFYLYHSVDDAKTGSNFGGSGFIVSVPASVSGYAYHYAVTNWHVAVRDGASVVRVNAKEGAPDIFEYGPEDWEFDPRYDIAVIQLPLTSKKHAYATIHVPNGFVLKDSIEKERLGPGEDVFMVGRFIDHDGGATNRPAVRFGNISVMPAPIKQPNGAMADAYCIDLHSRSGYSGSPVLVYRTPGFDLEERGSSDLKKSHILLAGANYLAVLGIHFAQFPEKWELEKGSIVEADSSLPLIREGEYVKGMSGMTCVLPSWYILDVLNMPKLKASREAANKRLEAKLAAAGKSVPAEESAPLADDANPNHREDFTALLGAALKKPTPKE